MGVTLYEFLTTRRPYNEETIKKKKYESERRAKHKKISLKYWKFKTCETVSANCKLLINGLLIINPEYRIGSKSTLEIKDHPWFKNFDWQSLSEFKYPNIPFVPDISKANVNGNADIGDCLDENESDKIPIHLQAMFHVLFIYIIGL